MHGSGALGHRSRPYYFLDFLQHIWACESYKELGFQEASEIRQQMERDADDLFGAGHALHP